MVSHQAPEKSHSAMVTKLACEVPVHITNSVEGAERCQEAELEAEWARGGKKRLQTGAVTVAEEQRCPLCDGGVEERENHPLEPSLHRSMENSTGEEATVDKSLGWGHIPKTEPPCLYKNDKHLTKKGQSGSLGWSWEASGGEYSRGGKGLGS